MEEISTVKVIKGQNKFNLQGSNIRTLRVAAYCRVSKDKDEQLKSFSSQVKYYTDKIKSNPNWEFVEIYSDEAITGTKVDLRDGFQKMITDCVDKKIDLILTKSISRFARNTVDTLYYVRKLKEKNIAVFFEEENINTLTMEGELLLTILSSVAQQEVQNISEHVKKGLKMKIKKGSPVGFTACLGYDYNLITKEIKINLEESKIIKYIFERYASGTGSNVISKELRELNVRSKRGNIISSRGVCEIILNEKYKGDLLFGKTYTIDPIDKKRVRNKGQSDQYYLENHHDAIVSKELWEKANQIMKKRSIAKKISLTGKFMDFTGKFPLSKKIKCGFCGTSYTRRTQMQTSMEKKPVWKCNKNTALGVKYCPECKAIDDRAVKKGFVEALSILVETDTTLLDSFMETLKENIISSDPQSKIAKLKNDLKSLNIRKNNAIDLMLDGGLTREEYDKRVDSYSSQIIAKSKELEMLEELAMKQDSIQQKLVDFKSTISKNISIEDFDNDVCESIIDRIIVGGTDENNEKNPFLVTYVFDINCDSEVPSKDDYFIIGSFNCKYRFQSYDMGEYGFRTRLTKESFPVRIALKIK